MKRASWGAVLIVFGVLLGAAAAQNADLSGTWILNLQKSHWGNKPKPIGVTIAIDHKDPSYQYKGTVTQTTEDAREFTFSGAIDGKEYPMTAAAGPGTAILKRINPYTIEVDFRSSDGQRTENIRTSISTDGQVLTRTITEQTPEAGTRTWTEVYDRR
jgi:hypothetical protein